MRSLVIIPGAVQVLSLFEAPSLDPEAWNNIGLSALSFSIVVVWTMVTIILTPIFILGIWRWMRKAVYVQTGLWGIELLLLNVTLMTWYVPSVPLLNMAGYFVVANLPYIAFIALWVAVLERKWYLFA